MNTDQNFENSLKDLLEHLHDSYKGYHESADDIKSDSLKIWFRNSAEKRKLMIAEFESLLSQNNINFNHHGTMTGMIHRMFVNLKSIVTGKDEKAILAEVERGEDFLVREYKSVLNSLPTDHLSHDGYSNLLQNQLSEIEQNLSEIKSLNI